MKVAGTFIGAMLSWKLKCGNIKAALLHEQLQNSDRMNKH